MSKWKTNNSNLIIDSDWVKVRKDNVTLPNGCNIDDFYVITIKNASAVVALDKDRNIILKKEYRYTYDSELVEIPAGVFNKDETDSLDVAKRELLEETGYCSDNWLYLGATIESSAKFNNHIHLYFADNCYRVAEQKLDESEQIEILKIPFSKAIDMVMRNEICCNSSANAILKVARMLKF